MKKLLSFLLCAVIIVSFPIGASAAQKPDVAAEAFVLYCPDNGQIVLSKDENKKMRPASTTKLMTTLLTLEAAEQDDQTVTFTQDMVAEGSSMYLKLGEKVLLSDLAAGMMMASGNDAANAAALTLADSAEAFSKLMNERASQLKMENTHFVTPSGLDDDNHYSTAYDMALLMSAALTNSAFQKLTSQKSVTVNFTEPKDKVVTYSNHNRLLSMYEYCVGGKTGYTMAAGRCLVSAAKKDGLTLICVTLNDKNDWNDHIKLYEYGFETLAAYTSPDSSFCVDIPCVGGTEETTAVVGDSDVLLVVDKPDIDKIKRTIYLDNFLYAPVSENQKVGEIIYTLDGKVLKSVSLEAVSEIKVQSVKKSLWEKIKEWFTYG